ncbi:hypothetical protein [Aquimarina algiphila]|uniref:hypothetical protein n=1 Tax=Aquimarina algiphila TaxID=2047982 RepID=UPI002490FAB8|nr:hypothetical protein [Aquimarina algiphila]
MNFILLVTTFIALTFFIINQIIKYKRFKYVNNLKRIYDHMEMFFVRNDIKLKNDYIELLKVFKNLSVNPDYLDIQVLVLSKIASERSGSLKKDTKWFENNLNSLGEDFNELFQDFDRYTNRIIDLSFIKPDFILFLTRTIISYTITSGLHSFKNMYKDFLFIKNNDEIISYSGMKLRAA